MQKVNVCTNKNNKHMGGAIARSSIFKYLSRKGKKAYWIGQLSLCIIYVFALLGLSGLSFDEAQGPLIAGVVVIAVVWGVICLVIWPVSKDNENVLEDGELKNERNG